MKDRQSFSAAGWFKPSAWREAAAKKAEERVAERRNAEAEAEAERKQNAGKVVALTKDPDFRTFLAEVDRQARAEEAMDSMPSGPVRFGGTGALRGAPRNLGWGQH